MLPAIAFNDQLWSVLAYLPHVLAFLAGTMLMAGWLGTRGWEPRCRRCSHDLAQGQPTRACPECGANLSQRGAVRTGHRVVRVGRLLVGIALVVLAAVTAIPTLFTPAWMRMQFGRLVSTDAILAAIDADPKGSYPTWLLQVRIRSADPAVADAITSAVVESARKNGKLSPAALKGFDEALGTTLLTNAHHARIADAFVEGVREGTFSLPNADSFRRLLIGNGAVSPHYSEAFLACDECVEHTISGQISPSTAPVGAVLSVAVRSSDVALAGLRDMEVVIERIQIRAKDDEAWHDVTADSRAAQPALRLRDFGTIESKNFRAPGEYEVAIEGKVELDGNAMRTVAFRRTAGVTITSRESIVATPVRGSDARNQASPLIQALAVQVSKGGDTLSMIPRLSSSGFGRSLRTKRTEDLHVFGTLSVAQGEHSWLIGDLSLHQGGFGFGGGGEIPIARDSNDGFDDTKPFSLRFVPDPAKQLAVATSSFVYLDEPFDLRFPNANAPAAELVWTRKDE